MIPHESGSWVHPDDPGEPTTGHPRVSVTDLEASILAALVGGMSVLEIGTGLGVSTRALASTAISVHTVDIDPWVHENIWPDLPDHVRKYRNVEDAPRVDAAFIDGDHSAEQVRRDVRDAGILTVVLIAHDTNSPEVREGLGDGWLFIPTTHGIGVRR